MPRTETSDNVRSNLSPMAFWVAVVATPAFIFSAITATTSMKIPSVLSGLLLVPLFTILMAYVHEYAPADRKLFSRLGMLFTVGYATLIGFNYFMQITLVRWGLYTGTFDMSDPHSIMWVIEVLGYGFMGLATLFAAWVFNAGKLEKIVRWLFVANGILGIGGVIGYALNLSMNSLYAGLIAWDVVMPVSATVLSILFRKRAMKTVNFQERKE